MNNFKKSICIIGMGRQGRIHLKAAVELQRMNLIDKVFTYDIDDEPVSEIKNDFKFLELSSLNEIKDQDVLCVLCTPNNTHDEIIKRLVDINSEVVILKEKPINEGQLVDLVGLHIAQQRFFNKSYVFAKKNIDLIGKISYFDYQYTLNDNEESWYWDKKRGGGCFLNVGWHFIFIINWFFGEPITMTVEKIKTGRKSFEYDTDDTVFIDAKYNNFFGKAYLSVADSSKRDSFRIIGDKGTIEVNKKECNIYGQDGKIIKKDDGNEMLSYMEQLWKACSNEKNNLTELKVINNLTNDIVKNYEKS